MVERAPADPGAPATFVATVPYTVRACREADLPALEWFGLYREHRDIIRRTFQEMQQGAQLMWVADVGGFPAAQLWADRPRARLWAARVFPPLQGFGIGSHVLSVAEQALAASGIRRLSVAVEVANATARRFWTDHGYRPARVVTERWGYVSPGGAQVEVASELEVMEKDVGGET